MPEGADDRDSNFSKGLLAVALCRIEYLQPEYHETTDLNRLFRMNSPIQITARTLSAMDDAAWP